MRQVSIATSSVPPLVQLLVSDCSEKMGQTRVFSLRNDRHEGTSVAALDGKVRDVPVVAELGLSGAERT